MKVLIAEDDPVSRRVLEATLQKWGYEVTVTSDGTQAWEVLCSDTPPELLIFDWMMPGMDGPTICRKLRERADGQRFYVLLLTAKVQKDDIVAGLDAGADDYVTKPFHREELRARVRTGQRLIDLQHNLAARIHELEMALSEVRTLSGLLPICSYCGKIREGDAYLQSVEQYIARHTDAQFSHGVCPDCYDRVIRPQLEEL